MTQPYRVVRAVAILLIGVLVGACSALPGQTPTATPIPFDRFRAQEVIEQLSAVGLTFQNAQSNTVVGRGAPATFNTRIIFEIPRIAPGGGQIMTFADPEALQAWQDFVTDMRNDPATRRDVVYVYVNQNALLQLNADLTNQEAQAYRDAFLALQ